PLRKCEINTKPRLYCSQPFRTLVQPRAARKGCPQIVHGAGYVATFAPARERAAWVPESTAQTEVRRSPISGTGERYARASVRRAIGHLRTASTPFSV